MKCQILHETKNRMRVHFCKENMTIEEADKADAYLKSISGIDDVTVYERTGDLIIYYSFYHIMINLEIRVPLMRDPKQIKFKTFHSDCVYTDTTPQSPQ